MLAMEQTDIILIGNLAMSSHVCRKQHGKGHPAFEANTDTFVDVVSVVKTETVALRQILRLKPKVAETIKDETRQKQT